MNRDFIIGIVFVFVIVVVAVVMFSSIDNAKTTDTSYFLPTLDRVEPIWNEMERRQRARHYALITVRKFLKGFPSADFSS